MSKMNGRTYRIEVAEVAYKGQRKANHTSVQTMNRALSKWLSDRGLLGDYRGQKKCP